MSKFLEQIRQAQLAAQAKRETPSETSTSEAAATPAPAETPQPIPEPISSSEAITSRVAPRWAPYKTNKTKCKATEHTPMIGKCVLCGDIFPCPSGACGHFDCARPEISGLSCEGNGTDLPENIDELIVREDPPMARDEGVVSIEIED